MSETEPEGTVVYEDKTVMAIVPDRPLTKGHIRVVPKVACESIQELDDNELQHLFYTASFSATSLFENLQAEGTNIIMNTGGKLKKGGEFHIDVLARKQGDSLNFLWTPKKLEEPEMKAMQEKIKDACDMIGVEKKEEEVLDLDKKEVKKLGEEPEEEEEKPAEKEPETEKAEKDQKPSEDKILSGDSAEQSGKESEKEEKKETVEGDENYLVKQLKRVP
ncbi:HIT family protein [Nanoarchaeota archaeon]